MPKRTAVLLLASLLIAQCLAGEAYIIRKNRRTLEQADKAYAQIHPVRFTPPPERWRNLHRTASLLSGGGELNVVMLGDSIINDISRSAWDLVLHRRYPACRINKTTCVRGSTGCWWYKEPPRVRQYVLDFDPDLVIIGGISHRGDTDSIAEVISQIRSTADPDILLMTGAFGSVEPAKDDRWRRISDPDHHGDYRRNIEKLARDTDCAFLDMEHAWAKYVRRSPRDLDWYKRDVVHANEYGEQILGRILYQYLSLVPNVHPDNSETDPLVLEKLERFQDWKFGFMMHWGIYSQWGCIESWPLVEADKWARPDDLEAWTMRDKDFDRFFRDYVALNKTFDPRHFDPARWLDAAEDAGMQYLVFTTKHHDGFCLFDTEHTDYRTTHPSCPFHTDPNADVIEAVFDTFRKAGFAIGAYYSKSDWHHPGYWAPEWPHKDRNVNYDITEHPEKWAAFVDFTHNLV